MRVLLTSSRAPVTLNLIRVLAEAGHTVFASDTFAPTLGSASRYLTRHLVTPPPRQAPKDFARALWSIVRTHHIDWLIPTCEEVFYIGMYHELLAGATRVLGEPLNLLESWHNKFSFQRRAAAKGLATPATTLVTSPAELRFSLKQTPRYLLKPAYSRFASRILTNCGPRPRPWSVRDCCPTPEQAWLVQEFIEGESVCSYSILHQGHVTAHCAYVTPHRVHEGSGVSFLSIEGSETLALVRRLIEGTAFTGQLSFDYMRGRDGRLYLLECNPRATSGLHLMTPARLAAGLLTPGTPTEVEPAGRYQQLLLVVLGLPALPRCWFRDVILSPRDPLPGLMQVAQMFHFMGVSRRRGISLIEATTDDIEWNGACGL